MTHQKRCVHFVLQVVKQCPKETQAPLALAPVSNEGTISARRYASRSTVSAQISKAVCPRRSGLAFRLCFTLNLEKTTRTIREKKYKPHSLPPGERLEQASPSSPHGCPRSSEYLQDLRLCPPGSPQSLMLLGDALGVSGLFSPCFIY